MYAQSSSELSTEANSTTEDKKILTKASLTSVSADGSAYTFSELVMHHRISVYPSSSSDEEKTKRAQFFQLSQKTGGLDK